MNVLIDKYSEAIINRRFAPAAKCLAAALLSLLLSGCVVGPKYHAPAPDVSAPSYKETPSESKETGDWTVAQPSDAMLRGKWWEIFNDPELNALEEQLDINNQNIKQFFENFMEARAIVREARSQYYPTLSIGPAITESRTSANLRGSSNNSTGSSGTGTGTGSGTTTSPNLQSTLYTLPLEATWMPDLWGKVRNTVRQAQYAAQVSAADLENERLTEQTSLAEMFFEIRGQDQLQKIFNDTVEADQKTYELTLGLYQTGVDNKISVVEAETTLRSAQADATNVGIARAQFEHAIAVLVGKQATVFSIPVKPMTVAPPPIPVGVPSELLERRPDIAAAERTMAEANALIGVERAAFFPTVNLTGSGGLESNAFKTLFSLPGLFWSLGASASQTLFDAGLRKATMTQYTAQYNADVAAYKQTILTSFQQVEDYIATLRVASEQINRENVAIEAAQRYVNLATARYETGLDPYLNVMSA